MKKLIFFLGVISLVGCSKDDFAPEPPRLENLKIVSSVGIKLQSSFVTNEVAMNIKTETEGSVIIKIFDIGNRVVSKETMTVKAGDNILKVYTTALPSSAYRIAVFDSNNNMLGVTDFNKL